MKKDQKLLRHALAEGIRTVAELAEWLKRLDERPSALTA